MAKGVEMPNKKKAPLREAVALEYSPEQNAPKIIASGKGLIAERMISEADSHWIPVHKDPELVRALNALRIGDEIPRELYAVVAQVLIHVGSVDMRKGNESRFSGKF